jgi:hypothetical protein
MAKSYIIVQLVGMVFEEVLVTVNDVRPFLMNAGEADLISLETFESYLGRY